MVDIDNLNRVKGILSARQGTEIPKFQNPASPLPIKGWDPNNEEFKEFVTQAGVKLTPIYYEHFYKLRTAKPNASVEQLVADFNSGALNTDNTTQNQTTQTSIPGVNPVEGNPTAAVEASADQNKAIEQASQEKVAEIKANVLQAPMAGSKSVNGSTPEQIQKIKIPDALTQKVQSDAIQANKEQYLKNVESTKEAQLITTGSAIANAAFDIADSVVGSKQAATDSNTTKTVDGVYDGIADAAQNFGPIGKAVGQVMKIAGVTGDVIQELGGGTDQQTTMDKWMDSSFFSWNIGMLNGFAGRNTQDFGVDQDILASVGSSYGGTASDLGDAAEKSGKKYGLFSTKARKKADKAIADAKAKQNLMGDISDTATDQRLAVQSMGEQAGLAYSMMTGGGYDQKYTYAAKHGGLLEWNPAVELEWQPQVELNWELPTFKEGGNLDFFEELEWIPEFKEGGKTKEFDIPETEETTQKNVIPEGALHKNKHHMEHAEGLTKKGIPVIDGDREQQAEIEHSEIIFTLEVTKKLEEYYEIFYSESASNKEKEQAALEAGKLLVYQILENTEDRTGLIASCKKGGTLNFKKSTEGLIEEALEWIPTITIIEEVIEEVKEEEKPKKKSEKEQMKEAIKEVLIELLTK